MSEEQDADRPLRRAVEKIARAQRTDEIEQLVSEHPSLASLEFLEQLDRQIDGIERTRSGGDWWGLTRARVLLGGCHDGTLKDALFRCSIRDLLPLGPEDIRTRVDQHPELLGIHADQLLRHWASQQSATQHQRAEQIELRRRLLRELAAARVRVLVDASMQQEREFHQSGDRAKLDQALAARKRLVEDRDAPFVAEEVRIANLQAVSRLLQQRFRVAGVMRDIDDSITAAEQGIAALPEDHPLRQILLAELGNALSVRFREFGIRDDIDRAVLIFDTLEVNPEMLGLTSEDRLTSQVNRAVARLDRYYSEFRMPDDLKRAIELLREVVTATQAGSPRRLPRVNNLSSALYLAYRDNGDREALAEAIGFQREVAKTQDSPFRVHALAALARSLDAAAQIGKADAAEAAKVFRQACQTGLQSNIGAAMWAGMTWGRAAWDRNDWASAGEAYGYCADGARLLFGRQSGQGELSQEVRLSQFREAAPRAAFALARTGRPEDAVLAFELGRAQLLNQAIERGLGLQRAPDLDAEIGTATVARIGALHRPLDINEIAECIQNKLLLYLVYTERGGVALLVRHKEVTSVELPQLTSKTVEEKVAEYLAGLKAQQLLARVQALDATTEWLWDAAMSPVLEELKSDDEVILVAGGLLGLLPMHAAWTADAACPGKRRYVLDVATFSYVPSARSFGVARERARRPPRDNSVTPALVVVDPEPVNAERLKFASDEGDVVKLHLGRAEVLQGRSASLRAVSQLLPAADFVHLACHGFADLKTPLESGLRLSDNEILNVGRIRELGASARLFVLSACETAVAGMPLPDEVVSMPTGLLQAGVTGIVASLWEVSDCATAVLMVEFYRRLFREKQTIAGALRGAQQWMRGTDKAEKLRALNSGAGNWLPPPVSERLSSHLKETGADDYSSPWWWGAFVHVGV